MSYTYLPCSTSEGMFPSEVAVSLHLEDGSEVSLFADKTLISTRRGKTHLRTTAMGVDRRGRTPARIALLHDETLEGKGRWLRVRRKQGRVELSL
jgi:hypothetical protein